MCLGVWPHLLQAAPLSVISISKGFSKPLKLSEPAETIAIGDPGVIGVNTLKPELLMINGQDTGATSLTVFNKSGSIDEYRIQVVNDIFQLRSMIANLEKKVTVEDLNGIIVLKGTVSTPTALSRVLTIADRFVTGNALPPSFSVISDHGGVLSGNLNESQTGNNEEIVGVSPDPRIAVPQINVGGTGQGAGNAGGGGGNGQNGASSANGNIARALTQPLMPIKGNLAQNLSRGEVIVVGNGKVMSMIKVAKQPKVEIQMQIIGIDRNKTDSYGIDWRLDTQSGGKTVTVGSVLGDVSPSGGSSPDQLANDGFDPGNSSIFAFVNNPGKYALSAFMRFLQQKGAAKTLSNPLVTAVSGESASFLVGGNIPIPVQTQTVNQVTATTATNVRFIQFGLKLIVRPTVLENGKISIVLDQSISEPDYSQAITLLGARIPGFNQRSVSTLTESASGETWAVAGLLSEESTKSASQVPWLSNVPVLGWLFKNTNDAKSRNELMILVNARVIEGENQTKTSFEEEGDLAPSGQPSDESSDSSLPEESAESSEVMAPSRSKPVARPQANPLTKPTKKRQTLDLPKVQPPPVIRDDNISGSDQVPMVAPAKATDTTLPAVITPNHSGQSVITLYQPVTPSKRIEGRVIFYQEFENVAAKNQHLNLVASSQETLPIQSANVVSHEAPESKPLVASHSAQERLQLNTMNDLNKAVFLGKDPANSRLAASASLLPFSPGAVEILSKQPDGRE